MKKNLKKLISQTFMTLIFLSCTVLETSYASLGQLDASIDEDLQRFHAVWKKSHDKTSYVIHEISNKHATIREFTSNGVVFAVAWQGIRHPDLSALLGEKYLKDYMNSLSLKRSTDLRAPAVQRRSRRHAFAVNGKEVVVQKSGRMGSARGKAYLPALMPEGFTTSELEF